MLDRFSQCLEVGRRGRVEHAKGSRNNKTTGSVARRDGVVPLAVKCVGRDPQSCEDLVGDLEGGLVAARVERGFYA